MQGNTNWRPPASPSDASMDSVGLDNPSPTSSNNPYSPYNRANGSSTNGGAQLRRRAPAGYSSYQSSNDNNNKYNKKKRGLLSPQSMRKLDFFEKVESDMTVKTDRGGRVTLIGYVVMLVLVLAEYLSWRSSNASLTEHVVVDTSLGKKMSVTINITFPSLHCDDLHVDLMDVAGDAQNNVDTAVTMVKKRLHGQDGSLLSQEEIKAELNKAHQAEQALFQKNNVHVSKDYCGPCYGAHEQEGQCCQTCDDVINAYKKKRWNYEQVRQSCEQCKREGKTKPKRMSIGEGCNLSGQMTFNRVAGNFHIAMGEGVERNGKHIHVFQPDDTAHFNSSHIIHQLQFGPDDTTTTTNNNNSPQPIELNTLDGVRKIVTEEDGSTGMFQYFIKVVPTTYKGAKVVNMVYPKLNNPQNINNKKDNNDDVVLETNRYFTTEVFKPLMEVDHTHYEIAKESNKAGHDSRMAGVHVGGKSGDSHDHKEHHKINNAVLPGVFFMYQIYPFAIEVTNETIPVTHLLIRIMATIGGVMTIVRWIDGMLYAREKRQR